LHIVRLLLAPNADLRQMSVTIEDAKEAPVPGTYQVQPTPPPTADGHVSWPRGANIVDGKDMDVYGKNAFFPASHVGKPAPGQLDRFKLVEVPVYPYRYNPRTGELRALLGGRLVVTAQGAVLAPSVRAATADNAAVDQRHTEQLRALVDNFDAAIQPYGLPTVDPSRAAASAASGSDTVDYLIITTEAIKTASSYLGLFADSKLGRNFSVKLLTDATYYQRSASGTWTCVLTDCTGGWGGGIGDPAADRIRSWLVNHHLESPLQYVLLVGNPHPVTGDVPMKMAWPNLRDSVNPESPTDLYYAELSGNWDLNGDGKSGDFAGDYGPGGCDKYAELSVGRIPFYGDISALDHILAKIVLFEHTQDTAWRKKALLPMEPLDKDTPGYHLAESIKTNELIPQEWGSFRIYEEDYGVAPELTPTNVTNVRNSWRSFQPGLTVWLTHGSPVSASDIMDEAAVSYLDDAHPAFVFQGSCLNAHPETPNNLAYTLLRNGAVGTVAATRVAWYNPGQTDYDNTRATAGGWAHHYAENVVSNMNAGDALNLTRSQLAIDSEVWWMNETDFNLYGDPSVGITTSGTGATVPPAPTDLTGFATSETQILLHWKGVPEASGYVVRRGTMPGGPFTVLSNSVVPNTYVDNTVTSGVRYYYLIQGFNIMGQSGMSSQLAVTASPQIQILYKTADATTNDPYVRPGIKIANIGVAPVDLAPLSVRYWYTPEGDIPQNYACDSATVGATNVVGRFVPLSSALVGADMYLELSFAPNTPTLAVGAAGEIQSHMWKANLSSYNEDNDYSYAAQTSYAASDHVTAYWNGHLVWGSSPSAQLAAPTGLTATAGNGRVSLSWTPVWQASFYIVYRSSPGSSMTPVQSVTTPFFVDTGLINNTSYSYYVTAWHNTFGQSPPSATVSATPVPPSVPPPSPPTGVVAAARDRAAIITWQVVAGATRYNLLRSTTSGSGYTTVVSDWTETSYDNTGLVNGTTYYYVVQAANSGGTSPNSAQVSATPSGAPCSNPIVLASGTTFVQLNTTAGACYKVTRTIHGWGCSNWSGRTMAVSGGAPNTSCGYPIAPWSDGSYYFKASAGAYPWASFYWW
jgi:fibronectin type 3 domain-containing protein